MINFDARRMQAEIRSLVGSINELPRHIGRKHLKAAMGRFARPLIPGLRAATPPIGTRRGRRKKGEKPRSSGALRRAVAVKTKFAKGAAHAVLGYRGGEQSRKAIWLEFGTSRGLTPRRMMEGFYRQVSPRASAALVNELRISLERATRELAAGKNPGRP